MKSILQGPKKEEIKAQEYPCLMLSPKSGNVFLMAGTVNERCYRGTVVHSPDNSLDVGRAYESIEGINLEPLKGKIILSNYTISEDCCCSCHD